MHSTKALYMLVAILALSIAATSQTPPEFGAIAIAGPDAPHVKAGMVTMHAEGMDVEPVKGAPFCATVVTEHTQAFADGNRIHTTDNSSLCRDSDGRIRREAELNLLGAGSQSSTPKLVTIIDPVAGYRYVLDSESKVAHRFSITQLPSVGSGAGQLPMRGNVVFYQRTGTMGPELSTSDNVVFKTRGDSADEPSPTKESLGDQDIDGIHATGTRVTTTIAAGKMGNELPMTVTSERWYSPELKATVMTKHSDPWAGELKTQLKEVNTSAPDPSLFTVPSDYKIVDEKNGPFVIQKRTLLPPQ